MRLSKSNDDKNTSVSVSTVENKNSSVSNDFIAHFIPFECNGNYYSFNDGGHVKSETGADFYVSDNMATINYDVNGNTKKLFM